MKKTFIIFSLLVGFFIATEASAQIQIYSTPDATYPTYKIDWAINDVSHPLGSQTICAVQKYYGTYPNTSTTTGNNNGSYPSSCMGWEPWSFFDNDDLESNYTTFPTALNGDYWQMITLSNGVQYYMTYERFGYRNWISPQEPSFDPSDFPSGIGIISVNSPTSFGTTSSPVSWSFDVYASSSSETALPDGYRITVLNRVTAQQTSFVGLLPSYTSGDTFNVSTSTAITPNGTYGYIIRLLSNAQEYLDNPSVPQEITGTSIQGTFSVGEVTFVPLDTPIYEGPVQVSTDCNVNFLGSDFNLGGCIAYMVSPASTTMQNFSALTLEDRFPFAYAYDIAQLRDDLFNSPHTGSTTLAVSVPNFGTITFLSASMISAVPYANTIKTVLAALLWFFAMEYIYKLVLRSHNQNTGV